MSTPIIPNFNFTYKAPTITAMTNFNSNLASTPDTEKAKQILSQDDLFPPHASTSCKTVNINNEKIKASTERLGKGGYGEVFKVTLHPTANTDSKNDKQFAVKAMTNKFRTVAIESQIESEPNAILNEEIANIQKNGSANSYCLHSSANFLPVIAVGNGKIASILGSGQNLDEVLSNKIISPTKEQRLAILAQICDAYAILHKAKLVHKDIKPSNILVKLHNNLAPETQLLDFGMALSFDPATQQSKEGSANSLIFCSYCTSIEEYKIAKQYQTAKSSVGSSNSAHLMQQSIDDLHAVDNPAIDVYGLGMMMIAVLFQRGYNRWLKFCEPKHKDYDSNITYRENFYKHISYTVQDLNTNQPPCPNEYSDTEIKVIELLIKSCMNPDPTLRPTAAQVGAVLETLAAGMEFTTPEERMEDAKKIRPNDNQISDKANEVYLRLGITTNKNAAANTQKI
ncbi:MAG: protein kinase [Puniceicoccales bacterium]|jgi:serine/threonine protein kinase|nr:protein kinase [Puniceicoccales bacterium]